MSSGEQRLRASERVSAWIARKSSTVSLLLAQPVGDALRLIRMGILERDVVRIIGGTGRWLAVTMK